VSATQTLVGAVFGVGLARGIDALNLTVIRNIFMSWIITIPVAAGLATLFFYLLRMIFGK
jgi:PiT family inorganic phosphate transporter